MRSRTLQNWSCDCVLDREEITYAGDLNFKYFDE